MESSEVLLHRKVNLMVLSTSSLLQLVGLSVMLTLIQLPWLIKVELEEAWLFLMKTISKFLTF